jgi:hypothetical protein
MHIKHSTHVLDVRAVPDGIERMETQDIQDIQDIVEVMEGTTIRRYLRENGGEKHA